MLVENFKKIFNFEKDSYFSFLRSQIPKKRS